MAFLLFVAMLFSADQKFELASSTELTENAKVIIRDFSADGKHVLYSDGPDYYIVDVGTGGIRRLNVSLGYNPRFSPDGQSLYFGRREPGRDKDQRLSLFRMPLAGGQAEKVLDVGYAAFSPDGKTLVFFHREYAKEHGSEILVSEALMVVNLDGSGRREVAVSAVHTFSSGLVWSPEGDRVAFGRGGGGSRTGKLMVTSIRTGDTVELAPWKEGLASFAWPPGGGGLYGLEGGNLKEGPARLMHCPLPAGQWTQVSGNLPVNAWGTAFHVTGDGLILATTRNHTAETFWDGLMGLVLWKQASAYDWRSELVITRLRKRIER